MNGGGVKGLCGECRCFRGWVEVQEDTAYKAPGQRALLSAESRGSGLVPKGRSGWPMTEWQDLEIGWQLAGSRVMRFQLSVPHLPAPVAIVLACLAGSASASYQSITAFYLRVPY